MKQTKTYSINTFVLLNIFAVTYYYGILYSTY